MCSGLIHSPCASRPWLKKLPATLRCPGGPPHHEHRFGHPRQRARHLPYAIGSAERDRWLACMRQARRECAVDATLAERLGEAFFKTADWMRNTAR